MVRSDGVEPPTYWFVVTKNQVFARAVRLPEKALLSYIIS